METTDKGKLQFKFAKDGLFESELTQKWFPDQKFSFTPAQFHFHNKGTEKNSEHTIDGGGFDAEMHIVSMNEDPSTQDLFLAAVIGILFEVSQDSAPSWADVYLKDLMEGEQSDFESNFMENLDLNKSYVYRGSLTAEPYTESIFWTMLADPV